MPIVLCFTSCLLAVGIHWQTEILWVTWMALFSHSQSYIFGNNVNGACFYCWDFIFSVDIQTFVKTPLTSQVTGVSFSCSYFGVLSKITAQKCLCPIPAKNACKKTLCTLCYPISDLYGAQFQVTPWPYNFVVHIPVKGLALPILTGTVGKGENGWKPAIQTKTSLVV